MSGYFGERTDSDEIDEIIAMDKKIEEHFGLNRNQVVATYDTTSGEIKAQRVEGSSIEEVEQLLGIVTEVFLARYDPEQHGNVYVYDRGAIYPLQDFRGIKVLSVLASGENGAQNIRNFYEFLKDRGDYKASRRLKEMFSWLFPRVSWTKRFLEFARGRE